MGLWNYCEVCGERIETGEPCIGVKEESESLCGASICLNCAKIENLPDGKELVSITDLLARAEAAEEQAKYWKSRYEEAVDKVNLSASIIQKADERTREAEERAEKAESERDEYFKHLQGFCFCCAHRTDGFDCKAKCYGHKRGSAWVYAGPKKEE